MELTQDWPNQTGVVLSRCDCCGELKFSENWSAYKRRLQTGEAIFCEACMELPEAEAERMILALDAARKRGDVKDPHPGRLTVRHKPARW